MKLFFAVFLFAPCCGSIASDAVKPVPPHGPLTAIKIDHAESSWSNDGGFICFFYFDVDGKRLHVEVNASKADGCPQVIWLGDRP